MTFTLSSVYKILPVILLALVLFAAPVTRYATISAQDDLTPTIEPNAPPIALQGDSEPVSIYDNLERLADQSNAIIEAVLVFSTVVLALGAGYYRGVVTGQWSTLDADIETILMDVNKLDDIEAQFLKLSPEMQRLIQSVVKVLITISPFIPVRGNEVYSADQVRKRRKLLLEDLLLKVTDGKPNH
jgi:hypothetical protein